jgi:streptomycin 6-kinase
MVEKAERLLEELQASSPRNALLHGDLHHDNILSDAEDGWVAIDPKGVTGDPAYEAARFQHNPVPGFLSVDAPHAVARRRADILSSILEGDRSRLLAWAFFDTVLSACWSIEEHGHNLRYHLSCAEVFDRLVE